MCLIVDANVASQVFSTNPSVEFAPVTTALKEGKARAVVGGELRREYTKILSITRIIRAFDQRGSIRFLPDSDVDEATAKVAESCRCVSNDLHIVALAHIGKVRLLCSHDKDLHADFTNSKILKPKGKVYQDASHQHLIEEKCKKLLSVRRSGRRR